jgi:hypothetical protein
MQGPSRISEVTDAQSNFVGRHTCLARSGWRDDCVQGYRAGSNSAYGGRSIDREPTTRAWRNGAALMAPARAALTRTVMREALVLAIGCFLILVTAAAMIVHFVP